MSATFTVSGTWTPLGVDFTKMAKTGPNVPQITSIVGEALKAASAATGSPVLGFPELVAFIQAMADGYSIGYNPAKALLYAIMTAEMQKEDPMVTSGTSRVYP